ncbi:MAG: tetratricopeptide repeat protein [Caldilineales bacterium]|nr:tetratricopeptide repeat protein [Caldilineales bacterium]
MNPLRFAHKSFAIITVASVLLVAACSQVQPAPPPSEEIVDSQPLLSTQTATAIPPAPTSTNTPSPTATDTPTATPTLTPTPTSTPTSTPTPAIDEHVAVGNRRLQNGDYESAADAFQIVLIQDPDQPDALFGLGKAYYLNDSPGAALAPLRTLSQDAVYVVAHPETLFWLGRTHAALGQTTEAVNAFSLYAQQRPELAPLAFEAAGNAFETVGDLSGAIAQYQQALDASTDLITTLRARERVAAASLAQGDPASAIAEYDAILSVARNAGYRAEMLVLRGEAQSAAGLSDEAVASFSQALNTAPDSNSAYQAAIELLNSGQEIDDLLRGRADVAAGAYGPGIEALYRYLAAVPDHDGEAHALLAQAYEAQNDYVNSDREWLELIETHPGDRRQGEAWLGRGRALWRLGNPAAAREVYLQGADANPDADSAATALWWAAYIAESEFDDMALATIDYERLARDFPQSRYAGQAALRAGMNHFRLGEYEAAQASWQALADANHGMWSAAADFWLGRLLSAEDDWEGALAKWQETVKRWGIGNHYGLRAAQELFDAGRGDDPASSAESLPDLIPWLESWAAGEIPADLLTADDRSVNLPELARPTELHRIGEGAAARDGFEALRQTWDNDPIRLLQLALHTRMLGYYDTSIRAAARVAALSPNRFEETPRALQELVYPLYFADLLLPAAAKYGIDPALLFALIRQESLFGATATSTAAARGLAQVIPSTGRSIAQQLDWPNYEDALLYRPYVSAEFGAFYLGQGLDRTNGNVPAALAGYNGGPGNSAAWRRLAGEDDDLFLEVISFAETQTYLRAISVQANHYRRLYPDL